MTTGQIEIREAEPGGPVELIGYGATFNQPYEVSGFTETIVPGAFKRSLGSNPDVALLINHQGLPLARTTSGTMTVSEDGIGLRFAAELDPSDPDSASIIPKLKRGDLTECSFAFKATQQAWNENRTKRTLKGVSLHKGDISIVTNAANPTATATLRAEQMTMEQRTKLVERVGNIARGPAVPVEQRHEVDHDAIRIERAHLDVVRAKRDRGGSGSVKRRPRRPTTSARSELNLAKATRAAMPSHPHVAPRYTYAEIQALGKEGLAHKRKDGKFNYPLVDGRDLADAILSIGRTPPSERTSVKRWIVYRAKLLGMKSDVPKAWVVEVGEAVPA